MFTTLATYRVSGRRQIGAANRVYPFANRNCQGPDGAIHAGRAGKVLVCRWQQSSVTGKLESVWGTERVAAASSEEDAEQAIVPLRRPVPVAKPGQLRTRGAARIAEWVPHWLRGVHADSPSLFDFDRGARVSVRQRHLVIAGGLVLARIIALATVG
jgi:hypothetical protein